MGNPFDFNNRPSKTLQVAKIISDHETMISTKKARAIFNLIDEIDGGQPRLVKKVECRVLNG